MSVVFLSDVDVGGYEAACAEIARLILDEGVDDESALNQVKKRISSEYGLSTIPSNPDILAAACEDDYELLVGLLQRKAVRTVSGVAVVAVMTSPWSCPHGRCLMCPGGPESVFESAQSYVGAEPAALRARQHDFNPYRQVSARLSQLREIGHPVDKAELIVMGGTITARPPEFQEQFVLRCLEAMNDFERSNLSNSSAAIEDVQRVNETAGVRSTGITFETRPDYVGREHVDLMLRLGVTKVELGVQHTDDEILRNISRGHTVEDAFHANQILRDSAIKVGFHMMPGLPGSDVDHDLKTFSQIFSDERFMPDYLKIYPTLVARDTRLYDIWRAGDYNPLDNEQATELIARIKSLLPPWVRLQRIQRDIPLPYIEAGVTKSNIRQLAQNRLQEMDGKCRCIRCREVGHAQLRGIEPDSESIELKMEEYAACGGLEHFISYEDSRNDLLIAFLRLRFPYSPHRKELKDAALIRELHVYGRMTPLGLRWDDAWQHRGYGQMLLNAAEKMSADAGFKHIAAMSGVGVREYYRNLGYSQIGPFMTKEVV